MASFSQQVIWTALPRPLGRKGVEVSVLVSPRLTVGGRTASLKNFPVWMDWPSIAARAGFTVTFGKQTFDAALVSKPVSDVWRAIFNEKTVVQPRRDADLTHKKLMSYDASAMARRLRKTYVDVARRWPETPPTAAEMSGPLKDFIQAPTGPDILKKLAGPDASGFLKEIGKLADLAEFHAFLKPFDDEPGKPLTDKDAMQAVEGMDFHRLVATIGQHALLLRQTGLVLDLKLDGNPEPGEAPLSVDVKWDAGKDVETLPDGGTSLATRYGKGVFEAVADSTRVRGRRLNLGDKRFEAAQVDIDGGVIKLTGTAASVASRLASVDRELGMAVGDEAAIALPTLRTAGIILLEGGRADSVGDILARSAQFETLLAGKRPVKLHAEDVTRGYHVDVQQDGTWRSLCRIGVDYELHRLRARLADKDAEGLVQLAAGEAPPGAPQEYAHIMRVAEALFHWDGWSLAAPRPGLALDQDGAPVRDAEAGGLPVSVRASVVPQSLPTLRFGEIYRLRVRLADLAHNAEDWSGKSATGASDKITYRRFEPIAPPVPALVQGSKGVDAPERGASLLRMVIRSGAGHMTQPTDDEDLRMFLPPRGSVEMAERHGVLDRADGRPDPAKYQLLTSRQSDLPAIQSAVEEKRTYPVAAQNLAVAPWLTDPAAERVRAVIAPDRPRASPQPESPNLFHETLSSDGVWPNQKTWTLRLHEAASDPLPFVPTHDTPFGLFDRCAFDAATRVMTVALPKGETATLTLSARFEGKEEPANLWGLAAWLKADLGADAYEALRQTINNGEHWAFTPDLKIELIHATQQPLVRPDPEIDAAAREMGATTAPLSLTSPCHAESTASLSLDGRWVEAVDDGAADPGATWRMATAFRRTLQDTDTPDGAISMAGAHVFGDTLYRRIRYRLVGASRFAEFFPPEAPGDPATSTRAASDDRIIHVPNASPPPSPVVSDTTPVFEWLRSDGDTLKASWRRYGVRVFLDRPWFATGFGEMLAAVLPRATDDKNFERTASHVSLWSGDPIWDTRTGGEVDDLSPGPGFFPTRARPNDGPDPRWPDAFPLEERALAGGSPRYEDLPLPDEDGGVIGTVDAAGHPVGWDDVSKRYYADLMMDPGAVYQPFLRLAVARLHPISVDGCHLSPAVPLPMIQVLPERLAVARRDGNRGWWVEVYGALHGERNDLHDADRPYQNVIRMEVQRTSANNPDELDWMTVDDPAIADPPEAASVAPLVAIAMPSAYDGDHLFPGQSGQSFDAASAFIARRVDPIYFKKVRVPGAGGGARGAFRWRIRVTETERHSRDTPSSTVLDEPGSNERIVFSETFEV